MGGPANHHPHHRPGPASRLHTASLSVENLSSTHRSLVPKRLGTAALGHEKGLLNLQRSHIFRRTWLSLTTLKGNSNSYTTTKKLNSSQSLEDSLCGMTDTGEMKDGL